MVVFYVFLCLFSFVWQDCSSQVVFFGGMAEPSCCRQDVFLARSFTFFLLILDDRSALSHRLLTDTRPPAAFSVVFRPCRRKIRSCRSPVIGAWCPPARGPFAVWWACGPRAAFFWPISTDSSRSASDVRLGGTGVSACPSRAAIRLLGPFPPLPVACFEWFLLQCRVFFFFFSWVTVYLC